MTPHYVTTGRGQVRIWLEGTGPTLVLLAGPTRTASVLVADLARVLPDRRIVAVEPPGIGGSARVTVTSIEDAASAVVDALAFLADEPVELVACELAASLVPFVASQLTVTSTALVGADGALGWTGLIPPDPAARDDGTHLNALWSFLRDRRLVRADAPTLPIASGAPLPDVADLSATFVAAATSLPGFGELWTHSVAALPSALAALPDAVRVDTVAELAAVLPAPGTIAVGTPAPTAPAPGVEIWHQFLDTAVGRVHLRRAGSSGRPVLVLPTGGGSSAQFAPVLQGLAATRTAVAMDYFGNGLSEKVDRVAGGVDIAVLAREAFAVADALGWDTFDVWGSHTGACVALEMTILAPERIGRGVYEAPVMVTPQFRDDLLANYFPDLAPDKFGLHLQLVWNWRRDMFSYWPWYRVEHEATRAIGIPTAEDLQLYAVGILESGTSYDLAYRAGFGYDTRSRLPLLRRPAILTAGPHDMLANALDDAASLVPDDLLQIVPTPATVWWPAPDAEAAEQSVRIYREFLR